MEEWEEAFDLKLYAIYLRGIIEQRRVKKNSGVHGNPDKEIRRCRGYSRPEVNRDSSGYGRYPVRL